MERYKMEMKLKFSMIVVCLNPGEKLRETVNNLLGQTYDNMEIIVKDGGSTDGSAAGLPSGIPALKYIVQQDTGIYDAMNQAIMQAEGDYLMFINCGDALYAKDTLQKAAEAIEQTGRRQLYYGHTYCKSTGTIVRAAAVMNKDVCYRYIPCHQACIFHRSLFETRQYDTRYRIRADYAFFLETVLGERIEPGYLDMPIASYEGDGFSESRKNRDRDREEHRQIVEKYYSKQELRQYRRYMILTLQPLRKAIVGNRVLAKYYNGLKNLFR